MHIHALFITKPFCRQDGGIASPPSLRTTFLPPLVKGEVLSPQKNLATTGGIAAPTLAPHQPFPNRTIPLAFRRMSVCVCLVGFASLQSTWAHTLRHPCLACSSRCTEYCHSHNNCKKTIIPQKSPSPLPPLSKGGGLTARHKPLYCCFLLVLRPPFLFTKPFCRQDGGIATSPRPTPTLPNPHYPTRFSCCEFDSPTSHKIKSAPVFTGANSSSH